MLRKILITSSEEHQQKEYLIDIPYELLDLDQVEIVKMFLNRTDEDFCGKNTQSWTGNSFEQKQGDKRIQYLFSLDRVIGRTLMSQEDFNKANRDLTPKGGDYAFSFINL